MTFPKLMLISLTLTFFASVSLAETIELKNGDILRGKVVSLDGKQLTIESKSMGRREISRDKIASIAFVEPSKQSNRRSFSITKMLRDLRAEGLDEETWKDVKKRLQVLESPEMKRYFNDTVSGLMNDMENLRNDAKEVQNEIEQLQKEYGPKADTFNDYVVALQQMLGTSGQDEEAADKATVTVEADSEGVEVRAGIEDKSGAKRR